MYLPVYPNHHNHPKLPLLYPNLFLLSSGGRYNMDHDTALLCSRRCTCTRGPPHSYSALCARTVSRTTVPLAFDRDLGGWGMHQSHITYVTFYIHCSRLRALILHIHAPSHIHPHPYVSLVVIIIYYTLWYQANSQFTITLRPHITRTYTLSYDCHYIPCCLHDAYTILHIRWTLSSWSHDGTFLSTAHSITSSTQRSMPPGCSFGC